LLPFVIVFLLSLGRITLSFAYLVNHQSRISSLESLQIDLLLLNFIITLSIKSLSYETFIAEASLSCNKLSRAISALINYIDKSFIESLSGCVVGFTSAIVLAIASSVRHASSSSRTN